MEWNGKWDWDNLVLFGSKTTASPNKLRLTDWGMEDGGDIDTRSFSLSTVVGGSGCSASDIGYNSSSKSSISASTESSVKDVVRKSDIAFKDLGGFSVDFNKKKGFAGELNGNPPLLEASVGSGEPVIGLKLGKRTYFENIYAKNNINAFSSSAAAPLSSISTVKKVKSGCQSVPTPRCQVEDCNLDLSSVKEYHKKHRVCERHSKSPKVIVGGLERRFCQQCSRFHSLTEFDENKRSCRRRLSEHNARRRKPQQETIQFNSNIPSSSFYDGEQPLSFMPNDVPVIQSGHVLGPTWESACCSKYTVDKFKVERVGGLNCPGTQYQHALSITDRIFDGISLSKGSREDSLDQGFKEPAASNTDAALDLRRALSLLSNNSWGSSDGPEFITSNQQIHANHAIAPQHGTYAVPRALMSSAEFCQVDQQAVVKASSKSVSQFQEVPPIKLPFEAYIYSNPLE